MPRLEDDLSAGPLEFLKVMRLGFVLGEHSPNPCLAARANIVYAFGKLSYSSRITVRNVSTDGKIILDHRMHPFQSQTCAEEHDFDRRKGLKSGTSNNRATNIVTTCTVSFLESKNCLKKQERASLTKLGIFK